MSYTDGSCHTYNSVTSHVLCAVCFVKIHGHSREQTDNMTKSVQYVMNESCHTYEWVTYEWVMSHIWMSHIPYVMYSMLRQPARRHVRKKNSMFWMSHVPCVMCSVLHRPAQRLVRGKNSMLWMSHLINRNDRIISYTDESCHMYERVMSNGWSVQCASSTCTDTHEKTMCFATAARHGMGLGLWV